jgi:hypothetical protein
MEKLYENRTRNYEVAMGFSTPDWMKISLIFVAPSTENYPKNACFAVSWAALGTT